MQANGMDEINDQRTMTLRSVEPVSPWLEGLPSSSQKSWSSLLSLTYAISTGSSGAQTAAMVRESCSFVVLQRLSHSCRVPALAVQWVDACAGQGRSSSSSLSHPHFEDVRDSCAAATGCLRTHVRRLYCVDEEWKPLIPHCTS